MRVRAILKLRNDAMVSAREAKGWTQDQAAAMAGVPKHVVTTLESMITADNDLNRNYALKIAIALGLQPDDVMPDDYTPMKSSKHQRVIEMTPLQLSTVDQGYVASLPAPVSDDFDIDTFVSDVLPKSLDYLTTRQRRVVEMRYGINGSQKSTLEEVGKRLGLTKGRVGQIEQKALYKMRATRGIQKFVEDSR